VNGSETFHIRRSENFKRTQQKLVKDHYRKNPKGLENFIELIQKLVMSLSVVPRPNPPLGHLEPFPKGSSQQGYELWKLEFNMPQLQGGAKQGRLIYLLNLAQKQVTPLWIYTHAEFKKRPPDRELKRFLLEVIEADLDPTNAVESWEEETGTEESNPDESSRDE
jgi:hypothetical protein